MKKTIIFGAIFFLSVNTKAQLIDFGIKGGINFASVHYNTGMADIKTKIGPNGGLFAHFNASKTWAIQPEITYSLEGGQVPVNGNSSELEKYNLTYINIPVLLQYTFINGFRLEGGPQMGFLLGARSKVDNTTTVNTDFNSTAFSLDFGVGYLVGLGVGFDVRYAFGLSNINNQTNTSTVESSVFQLGIFYQLSDNWKHHNQNN